MSSCYGDFLKKNLTKWVKMFLKSQGFCIFNGVKSTEYFLLERSTSP